MACHAPSGLLQTNSYIVPEGGRRERVDKVLAHAFPEHSRVAFQRALDSNKPAIIECRVDPEALTPRQTLTQIRQAGGKK